MARISQLITPVLLAFALGMTACVGPDEGGMSSPAPEHVTVSQGLTVSPTFSLQGLELLSRDVRLTDLRFSGVELVFTSLDGDHEDVIVPIDAMAFGSDGSSEGSSDVAVPLPEEGRYSVRMQVQSSEVTDEEDDDSSCVGMCFGALINPGAPSAFDSHLSDGDQGDGPNPHPFDGGAPSTPGGDSDPVADGEQGDGPNPHPFDGGGPSEPDDGDDPVADDEVETAEWSTLVYESDESMSLDMGEINVVTGEDGDADAGSTVVLCIDLLKIKSSPGSVMIEPAAPVASAAVSRAQGGAQHVNSDEDMHTYDFTPVSAQHLHEDARHINNRGRYYY